MKLFPATTTTTRTALLLSVLILLQNVQTTFGAQLVDLLGEDGEAFLDTLTCYIIPCADEELGWRNFFAPIAVGDSGALLQQQGEEEEEDPVVVVSSSSSSSSNNNNSDNGQQQQSGSLINNIISSSLNGGDNNDEQPNNSELRQQLRTAAINLFTNLLERRQDRIDEEESEGGNVRKLRGGERK